MVERPIAYMNTIYVAWRDPIGFGWYPVGRLDEVSGLYTFRYIRGVEAAMKNGFSTLLSFPVLDREYVSNSLFPLFQNRLISPSRPDYKEHLDQLALSVDQAEPMEVLARSGGRRVTDTLELFARPTLKSNGTLGTHFFARSVRDIAVDLSVNDRLRLCHDPQNPTDENAILLITDDGASVGWIPRHLNKDLLLILKHDPSTLVVSVEKVNAHPIPFDQRLLCRTAAPWPKNLNFDTDEYSEL